MRDDELRQRAEEASEQMRELVEASREGLPSGEFVERLDPILSELQEIHRIHAARATRRDAT